MWEADGWGWRARIGVLVPHGDVNPEGELRAMAPDGVSIHTARVPFGAMSGGLMDPTISLAPVRAIIEPPNIDEATAMLADAPVHVIGFAFTSSSYLGLEKDDAALAERLTEKAGGTPVLTTGSSAVAALHAVGAHRLALINPPWFDDELNELGRNFFSAAGFDVVHVSSAQIPSSQRDVHPGAVYEYARMSVPEAADAVFFGGNGFRTAGLIRALEEDLDKPVLTANQVLLWRALEMTGVHADIANYGRLLRRPATSAAREERR